MEKIKNIPSLRFPEFNGDWEVKKIGDEIKESGYGPRFSGEDYSVNGNVKTIRGTDISLDGEILYDQVPIANLNADFIKNHILEEGDLVMITTADCGLTGVFRKQNIDYIPSAYAVKLRLKESAYPEYFKYLFLTTIAHNQVTKFIRKATIGNLPGSDILKFEFNLPTFIEQTKIATFLTAVDDKLQALKQKKTLLDQYKKGVMEWIFSQEIRFKDDNGNDYPDWEEKKLGDLCNYKNGSSFEKFVSIEGIYNLISLNSIDINGKLKKQHKKVTITDNSLQKGDLIMVLSDVAHGNFLGLTDIIPNNEFVLNQRMAALKPKTDFNSFYLKTFINYNQSYFKLMGQGSSQLNLSKGDVENFIVKLPIFEEQTKIAIFLSSFDEKINHCQEQIVNTEVWKKGLLQQMFC